MKSWSAIAAVSIAVVCALLIPVRKPEEIVLYRDAAPEAVRVHALRQQILYEQEKLLRLDLRDSLTAILKENATSERPAVVVQTTRTAPYRDQLEQSVASGVARLGAYKNVDLGVFDLGSAQHRPPEASWNARHVEYLFGETDGRPYCIVGQFRPIPTATTNSELGACAFVLRHGLPGQAVAAWFQQGNFHRATWQGPSPADAQIEREAAGSPYAMDHTRWLHSLQFNRCLAGDMTACEQSFHRLDGGRGSVMDPVAKELTDAIPGLWVSGRPDQGLDYRQRRLLADLEDQFGTERFARFWTADGDVASAFLDAFGVSPTEWMHQWAVTNYPNIRGGFRAGLGDSADMILVILVGLTAAVLRERKRRPSA